MSALAKLTYWQIVSSLLQPPPFTILASFVSLPSQLPKALRGPVLEGPNCQRVGQHGDWCHQVHGKDPGDFGLRCLQLGRNPLMSCGLRILLCITVENLWFYGFLDSLMKITYLQNIPFLTPNVYFLTAVNSSVLRDIHSVSGGVSNPILCPTH